MMLVIVPGILGIAAVGTLLSSLVGGPGSRGNSLTLLVLPLAIPVLVAAAEATRLILVGDVGREWWRWVQFLAAFGVIFTTAGTTLVEFAIKD
jgi:heme exporter protein B